jgi:hypothetical protein
MGKPALRKRKAQEYVFGNLLLPVRECDDCLRRDDKCGKEWRSPEGRKLREWVGPGACPHFIEDASLFEREEGATARLSSGDRVVVVDSLHRTYEKLRGADDPVERQLLGRGVHVLLRALRTGVGVRVNRWGYVEAAENSASCMIVHNERIEAVGCVLAKGITRVREALREGEPDA